MGNGTKIGLVLVLVLIVVVLMNVFDGTTPNNLNDPAATGGKSAANGGTTDATKTAVKPPATGNPGGSGRTGSTTPASPTGYDAGRERRRSGADPSADRSLVNRTGRDPRTGGANSPDRTKTGVPAPILGGRTDPSTSAVVGRDGTGLSASPTGVGSPQRPNPADVTESGVAKSMDAATERSGSTGNVRPAVGPSSGDLSKATTPPKEPAASVPPAIVGRKPGEGSKTADVSKSAGAKKEAQPGVTPPVFGNWPKTHEIVEGDNLWNLAGHYYEKNTLFTYILENNPQLGEGSELKVGDRLTIPAPPRAVAKAAVKPSGSESASATKPGFQTYTIADGDTLYDIAEEKLGSGLRWTEIQSANPGIDPSRLKVGTKIQLPLS